MQNNENAENKQINFKCRTEEFFTELIDKRITYLIFIIYLLMLIYLMFNGKSKEFIGSNTLVETKNIVPFKTILYYLLNISSNNIDILITNTLGKIAIYIPLGVLIPIVARKKNNIKSITIITIIVTIIIQIIRLVFRLGIADIDNVILFTLGSIIGFLIYDKFFKIYK